jgi:hypothetical protein
MDRINWGISPVERQKEHAGTAPGRSKQSEETLLMNSSKVLLDKKPIHTRQQIANGLGVSDKTVGTQRVILERTAEIPHVETTTDTLGRIQPRNRKPVSVFNPTPREVQHKPEPSRRPLLSRMRRFDEFNI